MPHQAAGDFAALWNGINVQESQFLKFLKKLCIFLVIILILISFYAVASTLIIALISDKLKIPLHHIIPSLNKSIEE